MLLHHVNRFEARIFLTPASKYSQSIRSTAGTPGERIGVQLIIALTRSFIYKFCKLIKCLYRVEFSPQSWPAKLGVTVFESRQAEDEPYYSGNPTVENLDGSGYRVPAFVNQSAKKVYKFGGYPDEYGISVNKPCVVCCRL
jgi:hypothetical protein